MDKRPVIAIVAHDVGGTGGMERHLEELVTRLKRDANVIVVASTLNVADSSGIRFVRIRVPRRPAALKIILFAILASIRIRFLRFDILHTTGAIVFNRADVSTVHFCHAGYMEATGGSRARHEASILHRFNQSLSTKLALLMERTIYQRQRTGQLVAVSSRVKNEILHHFPYDDADVHVIPNGVDVHRFAPVSATEKRRLRKEKGLSDHGTYVLFMGGDWRLKGLEYVIRAFNQAYTRIPDTYLVVVGQGNKELYSSFVAPEVRNHVHFVGQQPDAHAWFGLSDVFVFPSSYETFSLVVHEAAASELVVLACRVGGVEDLIRDGVSGVFIDRDVALLTAQMCSVVTDLERYREMRRNARRAVVSLTWEKMYCGCRGLYSRVLESKEKHRGRFRNGHIAAEANRRSGTH